MSERKTALVLRIGGWYVEQLTLKDGEAVNARFTRDIDRARTWRTPKGARIARARFGKGGRILLVESREDGRAILGQLGKQNKEG